MFKKWAFFKKKTFQLFFLSGIFRGKENPKIGKEGGFYNSKMDLKVYLKKLIGDGES